MKEFLNGEPFKRELTPIARPTTKKEEDDGFGVRVEQRKALNGINDLFVQQETLGE